MTRPRVLLFACLACGRLWSCRLRSRKWRRRRLRRHSNRRCGGFCSSRIERRRLRGGGGDLVTMLSDTEARIRRRSALAIGRVKLAEPIAALTTVLQSDADAEVRQMAAFAMGLIGDAAAGPALTAALTDADPMIQGRAAEALGMIADKAAAQPIAAMVSAHVNADALNGLNPDDMGHPKSAGRRSGAAWRVCPGAAWIVRRPCQRIPRQQRTAAQPMVADRLCVPARQRSPERRRSCSICSTAKGS